MKLKIFVSTLIVAMTFTFTGFLIGPAYGQAAGGGGSGSGGLRQMVSAKPPGCKEGRQSIFFERVNYSSESQMVIKTCRDGSYMTEAERAAYIYSPQVKCRPERSMSYWDESEGGQMVRNPYICKEGKWVPF